MLLGPLTKTLGICGPDGRVCLSIFPEFLHGLSHVLFVAVFAVDLIDNVSCILVK